MKFAPAVLATLLCLPGFAWSAASDDAGVRAEIRRDMEEARQEIRADLAKARAELDTENLDVGNSLQFNGDGRRKSDADRNLPKAEITPRGDFLIDGKAVAIDAEQRRQLLAYRGQVIAVAQAGIDIGEVAALAAVDSVDRGMFSLLVGSLTGSMQRQIKRTVRDSVGPGVAKICEAMPALHVSQQQLAADLPEFRPYARLEAQDGARCIREVNREFARL